MNKRELHKKLTSTGSLLRIIRIAVSVAMLAAMTLLLTTLNASLALRLGWVAELQIAPLALSASMTTLAAWLIVTLLFGRVYCSSVCPLGTMQDAFSRLRRINREQKQKHPFHFSPPKNVLRYSIAGVVLAALLIGISVFISLLDPYSAYGRIASDILRPAVELLAGKEVIVSSALAFLIALATLTGVGCAAYFSGRAYCNTVCPVGSLLSIFSRYSVFHFDIDTDLCVNCRKCEHSCKAQCINLNDHVVDGSRCVACFNCVDACEVNAIRYTHKRKRLSIPMMQRIETAAPTASVAAPAPPEPVKIDRRKFLATGILAAATPLLSTVSGMTSAAEELTSGKRRMKRTHPVVPPGRHSFTLYLERCTGCGLCVAQCPGNCLTPSTNELGWARLLHPVMDYERGKCLYDCTLCTELCPTNALQPLTEDEKHIFIIGHARVAPENCIGCGSCAYNCPKRAISMTEDKDNPGGRRTASVDTSKCIGCGVCENVCPAKPFKAIIVDGII